MTTSGRVLVSLATAALVAGSALAQPADLDMVNRIRAEAPYAVALRRNVGENTSDARAATSRSTSTLHCAYAVWGFGSDSSVLKPPPSPAP